MLKPHMHEAQMMIATLLRNHTFCISRQTDLSGVQIPTDLLDDPELAPSRTTQGRGHDEEVILRDFVAKEAN